MLTVQRWEPGTDLAQVRQFLIVKRDRHVRHHLVFETTLGEKLQEEDTDVEPPLKGELVNLPVGMGQKETDLYVVQQVFSAKEHQGTLHVYVVVAKA